MVIKNGFNAQSKCALWVLVHIKGVNYTNVAISKLKNPFYFNLWVFLNFILYLTIYPISKERQLPI